ncbi:hypothetical protein F5Y14DRAFT_200379 [Nemania sp. NC0429]|nr:hypothetical protein F5Y14DRAFT_200379 [Nemania sp. NC0429]
MPQARRTPRSPKPSPATTTTTAATPATTGNLKQRRPGGPGGPTTRTETGPEGGAGSDSRSAAMPWTTRNQWVVYAVASGACAAFNGVFAKLTTNDLTAHIAGAISSSLGLEGADRILEIVVRCTFFGLNLFFNGVMWTLFTQALAKGTSTTQVSIMNTSTNFVITALLGLAIFAEALPPLWWVGAALLVVGNVIIGRKDENKNDAETDRREEQGGGGEEGRVEAAERGVLSPEVKDDEDVALLGDLDVPSYDR